MMVLQGKEALNSIDWSALAELIAVGGLGQRETQLLEQAFRHSTFCWFGFHNGQLVAAARAISDLTWCSYLADVVVAPSLQGQGYGRQLMQLICNALLPYGKIFIYSVPDKTGFYQRHGFELLTTGMVCSSEESMAKMHEQGYIL
ncbi:GNAT family N-acetyltransferase [Klebsiella sp. I138]|uniref:GNAT family N-acetyltransferase n=1 Tax=Klebsiella sp. I138 TaxID=2755385 RepID=UPI003DA82714